MNKHNKAIAVPQHRNYSLEKSVPNPAFCAFHSERLVWFIRKFTYVLTGKDSAEHYTD